MTCVLMTYMTGALSIETAGAVSIMSGSTFTGNRASAGGGGGSTFTAGGGGGGSTFTGNRASIGGGGMFQ